MVVRQDIDNANAVIAVTVTRDELKPRIQSELKKIRQRAPIKGFRVGQAPPDFVKKLYGNGVAQEVYNELLVDKLYAYLREQKLQVLGQPLPVEDQEWNKLKADNLEETYTVKYEVGHVPKFDIKGMDKKDKYDYYVVENLETLAEEDLEYSRSRMGKQVNPENDIQEKDIIKILAKELDGDSIKTDGLEYEMTSYLETIADEQLKTQILFMKKGDVFRFNARLLDNFDKEEMYRKYMLGLEADDKREVGDFFEGTITEVTRMEKSDLDDSFFNNYFGGTVSNKEEAIGEIKKGIAQFYNQRADGILMREIQERMLKDTNIELPTAFLKRWLKLTNENKLKDEDIEIGFPAFSERIKWSLMTDYIKDAFVIEVTDEDIKDAFRAKINNYFQGRGDQQMLDQIAARMMKNKKDVDDTRRDVEYEKMFSVMRDQVTLVEKPIQSEGFHAMIDEINAKAKLEQEGQSNLF